MKAQAAARLIAIIGVAVMFAFLPACKKKAPAPQQKEEQKGPAAPQVKIELPKVERETYTYDPKGRRDPFTSLLAPKAAKVKKEKPKGSPIENVDVEDLKVIAVLWDKNEYYAMILLPDNKSFTIKKGMVLGQHAGKVVEIAEEGVLIREHVKDYRGNMVVKDTLLKLRKEGVE